MNKEIRQRVFWIIVLVLTCFIVLFPLVRPGFLVTDDGSWMVIRLSAFYQSLREGQFPVRFLGRLNNSYGYPVANFLYPGFLYIGSFIHGIGLPFQTSVEFILAGSLISGAAALFLWLRYFFDVRASAIGAISFLTSPYILYDVYKRGSVGEILAIAVCLIALYALEAKHRWLFTPAIALLAISHNTLAMFFVPVLFGYIFIKQYWDLIVPFILGVGMSAFFWLPAIFERHTVRFDSVVVSDPAQYFSVSAVILLHGLPFLAAALCSFFQGRKSKKAEWWYFFMLLFGSAVLTSSLSASVWQNSTISKFIQFPFRFFALWIFAGPWFIASLANEKKNRVWFVIALASVVILFIQSFPYQRSESVMRPEGFYSSNEGTTTVANEYMPKRVSFVPTKRASSRMEIYKGNALIDEIRVTTDKIDSVIRAQEESIVQINSLYYPGWGALLDNKPISIAYDNPAGVMRVAIPTGEHHLYMAFRETGKRFLADAISVIFFMVYIIWLFVPRRRI